MILSLGALWAQSPANPDPSKNSVVYVCPMDRDIRSYEPGACPRCGMKLTAGVPDPAEYRLNLTVTPQPARPQEKIHLRFDVRDPWKDNPVQKFALVHEKPFHAFIVSQDLEHFVHDHPVWENGAFHYDTIFPRPGMYRVIGDFFPEASTAQLLPKTVFVAGAAPMAGATLTSDYSPKQGENLKVEINESLPKPVAGLTSGLRFTLSPGDGLEKYLGAWGHMLMVSDDLIDVLHTHPSLADGSTEVQFSVVFPRARVYRVWTQFQRNGVVNSVHFDVPVRQALSSANP